MKRLLFAILTLGLGLMSSSALAQEAASNAKPTLEFVLDQVRAQTGLSGLESGQAMSMEGSIQFLGKDADWSLVFDNQGRFLSKIEGKLPMSIGFDGTTAWERDWTDLPQALILGDRDNKLVAAWMMSGAWVFLEDELRLSLGESTTDGGTQIDFTVGDHGYSGTISLDSQTWLPKRVTYGFAPDREAIEFADWKKMSGMKVATSIETEVGVSVIESVQLHKSNSKTYAPQLGRPSDTQFDSTIAADLEVKRVPSGHLLVKPKVNGQDVGWFIFDTGAGANCVSTHLVEKLALEEAGTIKAKGIGGTQMSPLFRGEKLTLGPVTFSDPIMLGLDLAFLEPHFGVPIGGIVGYGLLARCVTDLDVSQSKIALYDPDQYKLQSGTWVDALIYQRHPCVRGSIEGTPGLFLIDTGAAGELPVSIHYHAVKQWKMLNGREVTDSESGGVGGTVKTKAGTLRSVTIGGREWSQVPASFALEDKGAFGNRYTDANIGNTMFEDYRFILDYPNRRLALAKRN